MIISTASHGAISMLRHKVGSNPEKSRLTNNERLHLIYMLARVRIAIEDGDEQQVQRAATEVTLALVQRGLSIEAQQQFLDSAATSDSVALANMIAVHPSLESADYLD